MAQRAAFALKYLNDAQLDDWVQNTVAEAVQVIRPALPKASSLPPALNPHLRLSRTLTLTLAPSLTTSDSGGRPKWIASHWLLPSRSLALALTLNLWLSLPL